MIKITLPDGSVREYEDGVKVYDVTADISEGLARVAMGAVVNGKIMGMQEKIMEDSDFRVVKFEDPEGKKIFWHTSAHIMAHAVQNLFPDVNLQLDQQLRTDSTTILIQSTDSLQRIWRGLRRR
jgi:threonyl-tRNA synthetase